MATAKKPPSAGVPPTTLTYHRLQPAFDFFNAELFDGQLPPCLITFQRKGSSTYGYYSFKRFATLGGETSDEIAINPRFLKTRSFVEVMSTLVHEMAHCWQHHYGTPSRTGYHNKEWAEKMMCLGLRPSRTGKREGPMTGQRMTHCIIPGGRFEIAVEKLRAMVSDLPWFDVHAAQLLPKRLVATDLVAKSGLSGRRTVYRCLRCRKRAESDSTFFAICGHCEVPFERVGLR